MSRIRLVAPFLPVPPENLHHKSLGDFDWMDSIRMLSHSAEVACGAPVQVLTAATAAMPLPCLRYETTHRRLMLWMLEVYVKYLESPDFDRDTVVLDCDQLIFRDLAPFFSNNVDLKLLVRSGAKHRHTWKKLLNGVQFWSLRGKARLIPFFREALQRAEQMPDNIIAWGADTAAIRDMLEPIAPGMVTRYGARVEMMEYSRVLEALSDDQIQAMESGIAPKPHRAVLDFRYMRKLYMERVYETTIGRNRS
jgi:hypothetical protein